ncbi:MAG: type II toxin-antitoxin system HicA family toxin [Bacteroidota bacterium]|nr:type II toxin-antitoxin system HicA family toxin [Bacteroidota bacterium]MDP4193401.1 type II toxin-antitoxin system HicA family toxin [Bacteroidota bacterium]
MKIKDIMRLLNKDGWYVYRNEGKYTIHLRHPIKLGVITITGDHSGKLGDLSIRNILDLAGL